MSCMNSIVEKETNNPPSMCIHSSQIRYHRPNTQTSPHHVAFQSKGSETLDTYRRSDHGRVDTSNAVITFPTTHQFQQINQKMTEKHSLALPYFLPSFPIPPPPPRRVHAVTPFMSVAQPSQCQNPTYIQNSIPFLACLCRTSVSYVCWLCVCGWMSKVRRHQQ